MSQPLARVTGDLDAPRGPDVLLTISVERSWFGRAVEIHLPRNLNCARCEGGGCDQCQRSGAFSLWEKDAEPISVKVTLPKLPQPEAELRLRIPSAGAKSIDPRLSPGHLLLQVRPAEQSSPMLSLAPGSIGRTSAEVRAELLRSSLIMAGGLILLFLLLLRLSGWL